MQHEVSGTFPVKMLFNASFTLKTEYFCLFFYFLFYDLIKTSKNQRNNMNKISIHTIISDIKIAMVNVTDCYHH